MKKNLVRAKLRAGEPAIGCFLGLGSPNVAELLAEAGFDWLVIETEHNALGWAEVEHMLMALAGTDTAPIVRVPSSSGEHIQRALDIGAMGVLVPMVRSVEEARAIVQATRYPPEGVRSFGPLRASRYSFDNAAYLRQANDEILVALILETKEAVENLDEILAVPGVDAVYLGPFDLCLSLGLDPLAMPLPEVDAILERLIAGSKVAGVAAGMGGRTPEDLKKLQQQGVTFLGYGPDYALLVDAARAGLAAMGRSPRTGKA
jgi:4-hydroxy-2-oxoheptanedioate aldolase